MYETYLPQNDKLYRFAYLNHTANVKRNLDFMGVVVMLFRARVVEEMIPSAQTELQMAQRPKAVPSTDSHFYETALRVIHEAVSAHG